MSNQIKLLALIMLFFLGVTVMAQDEPIFKQTQLTEKIYQLSTDQGNYTTNTLVFVGDDGILLVDTDSEENAGELKKIIDSFDKGLPRYIINTHRHVEHIGGNAIFGDSPVKIAHYLLPEKLKQGSYIFDEFPKATYPDITVTDSINLFFNGEKIRIVNMGGSHDDNEIMVHFTESKVVHMSSLINGKNFPSIDADGDLFMFPELISKAQKLLPKDVIIVSGHNNNCKWSDLQDCYDMHIKTVEIVKNGIESGKDAEILKKENVLSQWEEFNKSYVSPDGWIDYIVSALEEKTEKKKKIFEPLYYALKDGGIDSMLQSYQSLKKTDEYEIEGVQLLVIGNKLQKKGKTDKAIRVLELTLDEFPDDQYGYYTNYLLAKMYRDKSDKKLAIKYCKKSIKLNPDFQGATDLLEELKKM